MGHGKIHYFSEKHGIFLQKSMNWLSIISILKDSKYFVKLKIISHGVSNFKVLVVTLILNNFLGRRDGKDWLYAHLVQRAG